MKFDDLDTRMRLYETAHDHCVMPGLFMVVRLDGRTFTRLTKETHAFEAPFDSRFRDIMVETTRHLMQAGFRAYYGYTESDEISIALHRDESAFGRKLRKILSVLAGEASARFSLSLGDLGVFDARVSQLPNTDEVINYFRWRAEDAYRNGLNAHAYWALRREGVSAQAATKRLLNLSVSDKNELLFKRGINFNDVPTWQKRGCGVYWEDFSKPARNPVTGDTVEATRRRLKTDYELPMRDAYTTFIRERVEEAHARSR